MARSALALAAVALVACFACAAAWEEAPHSPPATAHLDHDLHGMTEEDIRRELHYVYSWGYESPPPPELADHLTYYPPKESGTVRHQRELKAEFHRQREADFAASEHGLPEAYRRHLQAASPGLAAEAPNSGDHKASTWAPTPFAAMDKFVAPAQAPSPESQGLPDCNGTLRYYKDIPRVAVNVSYNATTNASALAEARYQLKLSLQQPMYPIGATNVVFNTTVYNTLQQYGTYPRYHKKFGLAMKASDGRWFTYVSNDVWWWGADDWSTALWTCRYYQPGPSGFDCKYDRTCPGCDRCRGMHCYFNRNRYTYCADQNCKDMWSVVTDNAQWCMARPIHCGMSRRVGTLNDIGWPGYAGP